MCPKGGEDRKRRCSRLALLPAVANADVLRLLANRGRRCRWARLPRVDPLCDRMERGEEEASTAAAMHLGAANFADVKAVGFRRANAENFRPRKFSKRARLEG